MFHQDKLEWGWGLKVSEENEMFWTVSWPMEFSASPVDREVGKNILSKEILSCQHSTFLTSMPTWWSQYQRPWFILFLGIWAALLGSQHTLNWTTEGRDHILSTCESPVHSTVKRWQMNAGWIRLLVPSAFNRHLTSPPSWPSLPKPTGPLPVSQGLSILVCDLQVE